jgi:murein DD-endopeptidase MepM/ murein hydrolase activator NlpD
MNFNKKYIIVIAIIILLSLFFFNKSKANNMDKLTANENGKLKILDIQKIRNDAKGKGVFGASRSGHIHNGVDLVVSKATPIYAPFEGVIRQANPYTNDSKYKGLEIKNTVTGMKVKVFYVDGFVVGKTYKKGEVMAKAQDISEKYGSSMIPHIHVELRLYNVAVNPTKYLV